MSVLWYPGAAEFAESMLSVTLVVSLSCTAWPDRLRNCARPTGWPHAYSDDEPGPEKWNVSL